MQNAIVRGKVTYGGTRRGTVHVALFGREPGPPVAALAREGPGPYEFRDVPPGEWLPQACISDQPCPPDAPPVSFADAQWQGGRALRVGPGQVAEGVDLELEDKPRESMSAFQDGKRVDL